MPAIVAGASSGIGAATATGQFDGRVIGWSDDTGVDVAEAVYFGAADEAEVHVSVLEEHHHFEQASGPRGGDHVGRIAHRVQVGRRQPIADEAVFEQADRGRRVGALGQAECQQWQTHADEDDFAIGNLARRSDDHQLLRCVGAHA